MSVSRKHGMRGRGRMRSRTASSMRRGAPIPVRRMASGGGRSDREFALGEVGDQVAAGEDEGVDGLQVNGGVGGDMVYGPEDGGVVCEAFDDVAGVDAGVTEAGGCSRWRCGYCAREAEMEGFSPLRTGPLRCRAR